MGYMAVHYIILYNFPVTFSLLCKIIIKKGEPATLPLRHNST